MFRLSILCMSLYCLHFLRLAPMKLSARQVFGKRVREVRTERGWSQDHLADAAGLHRTYIGTVERAEQSITLDSAEKIARALKVPLADLFKD